VVLLAVNYHYVSEREEPGRAIFPATLSRLSAQVESLGRSYEFVSRDQLLAAVEEGAPLPERGCVITFDDGLRAQFELALPVLERLGVPAVFFIPGRPHVERRALHVHRVHAMRDRLTEEDFAALLHRHIGAAGVDVPTVADADARRMYRYDELDAARVKYLLNVALERMASERVVEAMFAEAGPGEQAFCHDLYMSDEQVRELELRHGATGAHGYDHHPFASLDPVLKGADMARGSDALRAITGSAPRVISYPYGSAAAVDRPVADAAERLGFRVGFTTERALNRSMLEPLLLGRVDTNDAPGGKRPLLELRDGEMAVIGPRMSAARERYFDEASVLVGA
jgi:peptidoglycan/xylan/chitin deacetylase (PgdA/CDA1 family)